jgi:hypothetical protein
MGQSSNTHHRTPLWEPAIVLPSQFCNRGAWAHLPEVRLMAAVLEDAFLCVSRSLAARRGRRWREFCEARDWFLDEGQDWPFAFGNVCAVLGLDVSAVRQQVRSFVARQRCETEELSPAGVLPFVAVHESRIGTLCPEQDQLRRLRPQASATCSSGFS